MTAPLAAIFAVSGTELSSDEQAFLRDANPLGFILFARNCEAPDAIRRLTADLRECVERDDAPVLIDQEGGTVMRLRPPTWHNAPDARTLGNLYLRDSGRAEEAALTLGAMFGAELRDLGIDVDCAPVADLGLPETTGAIGSRAYSDRPNVVSALARKMSEGLLQEGCLPVVKHLPGHGRARVDSHRTLPRVATDAETLRAHDFAVFRALRDLPVGMSAHVVFGSIDTEAPATISPKVISEVIREEIGFDGFLFSDDIAMSALDGSPARRAAQVLEAGCDAVLHCTGDLAEMMQVAAAARTLNQSGLDRWQRACAARPTPANNTADHYAELLSQFLKS